MLPHPTLPPLDATGLTLVGVAFLAGLSRGFSGFGGALILIPPLAAAFGPVVAAPSFLLSDAVMTLPLAIASVGRANWRDLRYIVVGSLIGLPIGVTLLTTGDPIALRWTVSLFILASLAILASGWRYQGPPRPLLTVCVGTLSGSMTGMSNVGGPPVIVYWLGGTTPLAQIRANIVTYFAVMTVFTLIAFTAKGLYTSTVFGVALVIAPAYGLGLLIGTRIFPFASPNIYRAIAYVLIALSATLSLPILDDMLRAPSP